ncbi:MULTISPECIES: hypothetical protein [unclassified Crossiella]|uniref:hypothetical protein n=1 Tax=unclassified Crossiella TaxID=2620835 RepID=UPI001FFED9BC|nr:MULTISPECIES: hypothetical protein [unclassified Crossiella]MCK2238601.1 hypothetical protein [Crossiella sp. S99.2]MCK2251829.1 hypothetical protein [Crossiella sp. S99.1]
MDDTAHHPATFTRRTLLGGAAALGSAVVLGGLPTPGSAAPLGGAAAPGSAAAAPGGFPDYRYLKLAFDKATLTYPPARREVIFPCVRGTAGRIANPLGRFYLYYAPHDAPGGICLSYADSLEGPFREYGGNPLVRREWPPHYDFVTHVSSPHVLWNSRAKEMWLYFHGENTTTRLARSTDGITFRYDKIVLSTDMLPASTRETSYARVFEHSIPARGANYIMVFMINTTANRRSIGWGWSADGRNWSFDQQPLIRPEEVGRTNLSGPHVLFRNDSAYVVYHTDQGGMRITEVGKDFSRRNHLGAFHTPLNTAPDNGRSAAPSFGSDGGREYMFYEAGDRLGGNIAIARAV